MEKIELEKQYELLLDRNKILEDILGMIFNYSLITIKDDEKAYLWIKTNTIVSESKLNRIKSCFLDLFKDRGIENKIKIIISSNEFVSVKKLSSEDVETIKKLAQS